MSVRNEAAAAVRTGFHHCRDETGHVFLFLLHRGERERNLLHHQSALQTKGVLRSGRSSDQQDSIFLTRVCLEKLRPAKNAKSFKMYNNNNNNK